MQSLTPDKYLQKLMNSQVLLYLSQTTVFKRTVKVDSQQYELIDICNADEKCQIPSGATFLRNGDSKICFETEVEICRRGGLLLQPANTKSQWNSTTKLFETQTEDEDKALRRSKK
jgi:hypothetical protein